MTIKKAMRDELLEVVFTSMGQDQDVCFVSADFGSPVLDKIRESYPDRFVNVGIAEQNLINVSTGLALEDRKVFAYAIAPFITMRCYEQIRVNLAVLSEIRNLNVNLIGVGAGFSYVVSGPTHQCFEDISIMRTLPNIETLSPSDWQSARQIVPYCLASAHQKYIRLDAQSLQSVYEENTAVDIGQGFSVLRQGEAVCLMSTGYMTHVALRVHEILSSEGVSVTILDMYNLSNFNTSSLAEIIGRHQHLLTVEEAFEGRGGLDALAYHLVMDKGLPVRVSGNGLSSKYRFELVGRDVLHEAEGIGEQSLAAKIRKLLKV